MLETIQPSVDNVVALRATGKVTGDDYETVLIPLIEEKLASYDKIRLLYHLGPEFTGYEAEAMWDDTKVGLKHLTHFEKIAVVTDVEWIIRLVKAAGFLIPGEVRLFANSELAAAQTWIKQ
jgi:hypothetical protein